MYRLAVRIWPFLLVSVVLGVSQVDADQVALQASSIVFSEEPEYMLVESAATVTVEARNLVASEAYELRLEINFTSLTDVQHVLVSSEVPCEAAVSGVGDRIEVALSGVTEHDLDIEVYACRGGSSNLDAYLVPENDELVEQSVSHTVTVIDTTYIAEVTLENASDTDASDAWVPLPLLSKSMYDASLLTAATNERPNNAVLCDGGSSCDAADQRGFADEGPDLHALTGILRYSAEDQTYTTQSSGDAFDLLEARPAIGDAVYFVAPARFAYVGLTVEGGERSELWRLGWEYWDGSEYRPIDGIADGTRGFSEDGDGVIVWDPIPDMPSTTIDTLEGHVVRATVTHPGVGYYVAPSVTTSGYQTGLWWVHVDSLAAGSTETVTLRLGGDPFDRELYNDFAPTFANGTRLEGVSARIGTIEPTKVSSTLPETATVTTGEIGTGAGFAAPPSDAKIPFIGSIVGRVADRQNVPMEFFAILIAFGLAVVVIAIVQSKVDNILVSVIAGGVVLVAVSASTIGIGSLWVTFVYGLIGGATVVIGRRPQI